MHDYEILKDLLIVFGVSGLVLAIFHRFGIPSVVGLLASGLVVGPYGLGLVDGVEEVNVLAEVGVVVLLFAVGLEFSLSRLLAMWRVMLGVGLPQVLACVGVVALATRWHLGAWGPAIFSGMLVAMSSTAVVLKVLNDRGELGSPQGRLSVAVLLLQDLMVTVFMISIPLLAAKAEGAEPIGLALAKGLGVVALVLAGSRYLLTPLLHQVVLTRNRELFLIFVALLCLGTALLTESAGLSLALGAFLAGLALSESEYAHQMFSEVMPFRDTLSSLFFVSVGMLLDPRFVAGNLGLVAVTVAAVVALKFAAAAVPTLAAGFPLRVAVLTGAALAQVGEFSFVLANRGMESGLLDAEDYQTFLSAAVVTMVATPFAIAGSPRLARGLAARPALASWAEGSRPADEFEAGDTPMDNHVIIVGFGLGGRNLARVLKAVDVPYTVLELNPEAVRRSQARGEPIQFGDSTREAVLEHAGVAKARALVVVISDPSATRRTVRIARQLAPSLHIVVRTRYASEIDELRSLGADEVVPEDFVSSVEVFARVLREYHVPRRRITELIDRIRGDQYEALRAAGPEALGAIRRELDAQSELEPATIRGESPAVGRTIADLQLRTATGATVVGLRRDGRLWTNPDPGLEFQVGDVALVFGDRTQVEQALDFLDPPDGRAS